ncbi:hypothetical protein [Bounagaea algeriensis]
MAGRSRTVDTGRTDGRRRLRQHRPAGEAAAARRSKEHQGARAQVEHRLGRTRDPLRQLDAARDYLRSAAQKYQPDGHLAGAIEALLAAGDELYRTGIPKRR